MLSYLLKRVLYLLPILLGVNFLTFSLFFVVNSTDDMAYFNLGQKHVTEQAVRAWKQQHGYDKPLFFNAQQPFLGCLTNTIFFQKSIKLFIFDFGYSDTGRNIRYDVLQRMWPSLLIALPTLLLGVMINIFTAFMIILFRHTYLETWGVVGCIILMSVSSLFYIIGGQYIFAKLLQVVPISGYVPGKYAIHFLILPILIGVLSGIGAGARWYRTIFLEEINKDYVRTARAKGLSEIAVLFSHVLRNALIPILTGIVVLIPLLFLGSLLMESFFGIPGLGSYIIDAIQQQDFAIVRCMVFLGTVLYVMGLILTDISYALVEPRIRFQ